MSEETAEPRRKQKLWSSMPWLLGLLTFLLYLATRSRDLIPGIPTRVLNSICGLDPIPVTTHRLYSIVAQGFARLLPGSVFLNLNLLSALCAAFCVAAVYLLMLHAPLTCAQRVQHAESHRTAARRVAALCSALFLLVSVPFWHAGTRAGSLGFDFALLLLCFLLLFRYGRPGANRGHLWAAALLYGVGITEYATMIAFAPLFGLVAVLVLLRRGQLAPGPLAGVVLLGLLGMLFYLASPLALRHTPDYGYGQYQNAWGVIIDVWKHQYHELKSSYPRAGGLLILLCCFAPWVYVLYMTRPRHGNNLLSELAIIVSLVVLTALGVALLLEIPVSPYQVLGRMPVVIPYFSIATWLGLLAGYWYLYGRARAVTSAGRTGLGRLIGLLALAASLIAPPAIAAVNTPRFYHPGPGPFTDFARNIAAGLGPRGVFFSTGGVLDELLQQVTWRESKDITLVSRNNLRYRPYLNYLAARFPHSGLDQVDPADQVAIARSIMDAAGNLSASAFLRPEMVMSLGYQFLPRGLTAVPVVELASVDPTEVLDVNQPLFDDTFAPAIQRLQAKKRPSPADEYFLREYSRCANNVGTTLMLLKDDAAAQTFYDKALDYFSDNPSALLNLRALHLQRARALADSEEATREQEEARKVLERAQQAADHLKLSPQTPISLAARFGYIYSEALALWSADSYRRTGHRNLEMASVAQARLINPDSPAVGYSSALLSMGAGNMQAAAREYETLLQEDPSNVGARIGLAVTHYARGEREKALALLEDPAAPKENLRIMSLRSLLYAETGKHDQADALFKKCAAMKDKDIQSLGYLALSGFQLEHYDLARTFAEQALVRAPGATYLLDLLVRLEKQQGNYERALDLLQTLLRKKPADTTLLEEAIRLSMGLRKQDVAREDAEALLAIQPDNFLAHFALSELASLAEHYPEMEEHLRACMQQPDNPNYPVALNNLAFSLIEQDRAKEALPYAQQAVDKKPDQDTFHHTLAFAYLRSGAPRKAEEEVLLALTLAPQNPKHKLLRAEILAARGQKDEARRIVSEILPDLSGKWRNRAKAVLNP